jgi:hypothetical protein
VVISLRIILRHLLCPTSINFPFAALLSLTMEDLLDQIQASISHWECMEFMLHVHKSLQEGDKAIPVKLGDILHGGSHPPWCSHGQRLWFPSQLNSSKKDHRDSEVTKLFADEARKHGFNIVNNGWVGSQNRMVIMCWRGRKYQPRKVRPMTLSYFLGIS